MRHLLSSLLVFCCLWLATGNAYAQKMSKDYTRVAIACCVDPSDRQEAWEPIRRYGPDLVLMMGDMIDVDADSIEDHNDAYEVLSRSRGLRLVRQNALTMAMWNEYDYALEGRRDRTHQHKAEVRQNFIEYWREPYNTERYYRQDGLYGSMMLGEDERRIQILMLDTRWHRQPLNRAPWYQRLLDYWWHQQGSWQADNRAELLGETQWQWLEAQLNKPATVRIIASSIPILAGDNGFDNWSLFPKERNRLLKLLNSSNANGTLLVGSGPHWGSLSAATANTAYPIWQVSPGSINQEARFIPPNNYRQGVASTAARYGTIEVNWRAQDPAITIATRGVDGRTIAQHELRLSELQPESALGSERENEVE